MSAVAFRNAVGADYTVLLPGKQQEGTQRLFGGYQLYIVQDFKFSRNYLQVLEMHVLVFDILTLLIQQSSLKHLLWKSRCISDEKRGGIESCGD